ncbi:MAG: hypothetical protein QOG34_2086, partial [Frankiaceae bacterium]|nr:hypothetical protein [Frankiaceae bacterium]
MTYVTTGLPNGGATTYYQFSYDDALSTADGRDRTIALMGVADGDFNIMNGWFGGIGVGMTLPMSCQVTNSPSAGGGSASWNSSGGVAHITLRAASGSPLTLSRWLLCAEVTEMFMAHQGLGWFGAGNEGSTGEGLSHFLANQLMISIGSSTFYRMPASIWLDSPRADWVNNTDTTDNSSGPKSACALLFLWYLYTQLGFSVNAIVAAAGANLGVVYRNLTGDTNDPFPYFKSLLDAAYPNPTGNSIPGPNVDNPFPLGTLTWITTKNTFGHDEVLTSLGSATPGRFPNAVALALDGFNGQVLGSNTPATSIAAPGFAGLTFPPDAPAQFMSTNHLIPQRITFPYDALFSSSSLSSFPASGVETRELDGTITLAGRAFNANTNLTFDAAGDPFFTNVNPAAGNVFWLSQDLRVFTATPGLNDHPVASGPAFTADSYDGAYGYLQALLGWLNSTYSNPSGTDPFDPATGVLPGQSPAYSADSSVTPTTTSGPNTYNNYNFAIARVRLNGVAGQSGQTDNVRVFFRVWGTQTADTDYQPTTTYLSHLDGAGLPDYPELPAGAHTIPFFATGNNPNLTDPANGEYGTTGVNNKSLIIPAGSNGMWAYYGCFLNFYDPANQPDGQTQVQGLLAGDHHCIVAQIAYDGDPIVNSGGTTQSPENSDKLAQRNLQVTHSGNPGWPATHRVPQTFDLRRSPRVEDETGGPGQPDELVIDWGNAPKGTSAQIFWPGAKAAGILDVASRLYGVHQLSVVDDETIGCEVDGKLTYIPIPVDAPQDLAGLLTLDMPASVKYGQEFNVVVRRISTRRVEREQERRPAEVTKRAVAMTSKKPTAKSTGKRHAEPEGPHVTVVPDEQTPVAESTAYESLTWRYVVGSFQVKVPVTDERKMLAAEENALAIFRWRLDAMPETSRWHRVLERYVGYRAEKVDALGGDAAKIGPSLAGAPRWSTGKPRRDDDLEFTGKVSCVDYDRFGDFSGFTLRLEHGG